MSETVDAAWTTKTGGEVKPGDRVKTRSGGVMTVTRIRAPFLGREEMVCLIEDTDERWYAQPVQLAGEVEVLTD